MIKARKQFRFALVFVLLLAVIVGTGAVTSGSIKTYAAEEGVISGDYIDFHGIKLDKNSTLEAYGLNIEFTNNSYKLYTTPIRDLNNDWSRSKKEVTLICTFPNLKVKDDKTGKTYIFRLLLNTVLNLPAATIFKNNRVYFTENVEVSLSNNYYKYFKIMEENNTLDFSGMQISMFYNGRSAKIWHSSGAFNADKHNLDFTCGLTSYNVPATIVDPESPDFDIDFGNTGTDLGPNEDVEYDSSISFWQRIINAFSAVFGGYASVSDWVLFVLVIVVALILLGLVVAFLRVLGALFGFRK